MKPRWRAPFSTAAATASALFSPQILTSTAIRRSPRGCGRAPARELAEQDGIDGHQQRQKAGGEHGIDEQQGIGRRLAEPEDLGDAAEEEGHDEPAEADQEIDDEDARALAAGRLPGGAEPERLVDREGGEAGADAADDIDRNQRIAGHGDDHEAPGIGAQHPRQQIFENREGDGDQQHADEAEPQASEKGDLAPAEGDAQPAARLRPQQDQAMPADGEDRDEQELHHQHEEHGREEAGIEHRLAGRRAADLRHLAPAAAAEHS